MSQMLASDDLKPIVEKLIKEYPIHLSEVDSDRIIYIKSNGKRKPTGISEIRSPYNLFVNYKFILTAHSPKFDPLSDDKKAIAIFDELLRIKDFEMGSLKGHSVVGNFETLSTWGLDWMEADSIPPVFKNQPKKEVDNE